MAGHGTQSLVPDADPQTSEVILSRIASSVGGTLRKNLASGDIVAAATIVVTSSGAVHWEIIENEAGGSAEERSQRLQANSARLAISTSAKAIQEKATNAILSDIK